jgi:two-component system response regulator MprA
MHLDIYAVRPEAGAIVHVHSPYATALACLRREVPAFHYMIGVTGGTSLRVADYLVKPFALAELLARLRALLRRRHDDASEALHFADLSLDPVTREARRGERLFPLTRIEFDLLELFLRHPRQVLTRELILDRVWGYTFDSGTNSLAVYVGYLRRKTEEGGEPRLIHTARGVGYVLREP